MEPGTHFPSQQSFSSETSTLTKDLAMTPAERSANIKLYFMMMIFVAES
jgi:hypothetical protein